ncbi:probable multidrug resistance-associated protein lethal(2)03659 isoform X2 [Anoplophora glabripennis]|nr:probable multidrug resistance-associated protein lethal(2)03659 isoform X2 [Anoplophora glabripennis]
MQGDPLLPPNSEKGHPLERATIFSQAFFCWLFPYFVKGFKNQITEDDMPGALKAHESCTLGNKLEKAWHYQVANNEKPSLLKALLTVFYKELSIYGLLLLIQEFIVKLSQPLLISNFLRYYEPGQNAMTKDEAYIYAGLIVIFALINVLCVHGYYFCVSHLGMKLRVATCSLIYRKALKLNRTALADTTVGQMVNLMSNDVGRFNLCTQYIHNLWVAPIETAVIMYLLYIYVGPTGLTGVIFLVLFIVPQMYMGKKISQYRLNTAKRSDERIRLMSEIITGVQVIKMYAWEKPFAKLVEISRRAEMKQISATSAIRAIMITCVSVLHRSSIYLCICMYVLTGSTVNAAYAFTIASFYSILRQAVTMYLPRAVTQLAETKVSVKRIERFLLLDEKTDCCENNNVNNEIPNENQTKSDSDLTTHNDKVHVSLKNVTVKWNNSLVENTLDNIDFSASANQLVAVVGKVGGGKSALFHAILRELTPLDGYIDTVGTVSYSSQDPWIFAGTIRQNITFQQKFNQEKYDRVVNICALEKDFELFPNGDQTIVGDRGVTVSGGQKARINLARAVYRDADIYLLDDPLSAVDSNVGKHIFEQCIRGFLRNKCVVLVTNQLQCLQDADQIYLLQNGKVEAVGSYQTLRETESDFKALLAEYRENEKSDVEFREDEVKESTNKTKPADNREQRSSGTVSRNVYSNYLKAGGKWYKSLSILLAFLAAQFFAIVNDYFVTLWVNLEQWRLQRSLNSSTYNESKLDANATTVINHSSTHSKGYVLNVLDTILSEDTSLIIYTVLLLTSIILAVARSLSFFKFCMTASARLHNSMFGSVIRAPMKFFNTNPSGRILNRFSHDIGTLDEVLPLTVADTFQIALILLSISIVIGCLNPFILVPTVIIVLIFYGLRKVFLATSRDIKRVEAVNRSPIFTHLTASVNGITTIRAFGAQDILTREFDHFQNQYTAASFLFLGANRAFGFWLDFHCVVYTVFVMISILFIENEIFGGNVGFALTEAVALTGMFQWGIRQWSEMENQMTAVERIEEYIKIAPESDRESKDPSKSWPEEGNITFDKLCLRYSQNDPNILENITFEVKPKEKIGVVGRTGAGKTSLIVALFRLTDTEGEIVIDNVNIKDVALSVLRSRISIIPQEPVLFSGTLRENLDPFEEFNDEVMWNALEDVQLKKAINDLPDGLNHKISQDGSNFSVGQRQLLCLARAIIRNNKILVLDEATANVDPYTDVLIQNAIREKFPYCTVLTIAHRLHTIMDSDKVLVMDAGRVVEFDRPQTLLQNTDGVFYSLVREAGIAANETE